MRKHLLREKKNKSICRYLAIDLSLLGPPHACLFVIGTAPASCGGTQNGLPFNIGKPITESYSPWLEPQGSDLCTDGCTLFGVTHGVDWIDFVKDSITLKETYNLTSDCIFPSFSHRAFPPQSLLSNCPWIVHFLSLLHQHRYLLFIKQYALTGLGDGLGSEGRMCKWVIIAWRRSRSFESC